MWFRQMAQLSTTISHAQSATAFHWSSVSAGLNPGAGREVAHLLDLESLLSLLHLAITSRTSLLLDNRRGGGRIGHIDVGHGRGCWVDPEPGREGGIKGAGPGLGKNRSLLCLVRTSFGLAQLSRCDGVDSLV